MIRHGLVLSCAFLSWGAACKRSEKAEAAAGPPAQAALKADVGGQPMGPLYGIARPDPAEGNSHRLTFSTRPIDCATFTKVLERAGDKDTFWIAAHEALKPDGRTIWAYGGAAFGNAGSSPAGLVAMAAYKVEGGTVTGTLPGDAGVDGSETLRVTGSFAVPVCEPLPMPKLRHVADFKQEVVPIEAVASTARATVAGKTFAVKGATALRSGDAGRWLIRLSEHPHGCSDEVRDNLVIAIRIGPDETKLYLDGHWFAVSGNVAPIDGTLKVDAKPAAGAVELTLSGAMDYAPSDEPYKVELSGTVTATECVMPG